MSFTNLCFIIKNFNSFFFSEREKKIADLLKQNALKLATAESCTGGLISSRLIDLSGSSTYIMQNFVTYSNKSKVQILGVNPETIEKFGVVSEEVAKEMAQGLLNRYDCTIAMSTTGIAGPSGGTDLKPVGLICIAITDGQRTKTYKYEANKKLSRRLMKYAFSNKAFELLIKFLQENY